MKRKVIFILTVLLFWSIMIAGIGTFLLIQQIPDDEYLIGNDYYQEGNYTYVSGGGKNAGKIFQIHNDGRVENIFYSDDHISNSSIVKISGDDGQIAVLLQTGYRDEDGEIKKAYAIYLLGDMLEVVAKSGWFSLHLNGEITEISADEDGYYISAIIGEGSQAIVYTVPKDYVKLKAEQDLISALSESEASEENTSVEEQVKEPMEIKLSIAREHPEGHFWVDAIYRDKILYTRHDGERPTGVFEVPRAVRSIYKNKKMSMTQLLEYHTNIVTMCVISLGTGWVVILMAVIILRNKNRIIYQFLITEVILLILVMTGVWIIYHEQNESRLEQYKKFGFYYLENTLGEVGNIDHYRYDEEGFYNSKQYYTLQNQLADFVKNGGSGEVFYDVFIVQKSNKEIMVSASGHNREYVSDRYGHHAEKILSELDGEMSRISGTVLIQGVDFGVIGMENPMENSSNYQIVGITNEGNILTDRFALLRKDLVMGLLIFLVSSLAYVVMAFVQNLDLFHLENAISSVSKGNSDIRKPSVYGMDMHHMWNSLIETEKRVEKTTYGKYSILEAYYRFIPKKIEEILGKQSITEVDPGDTINRNATLALISGSDWSTDSKDVVKRLGSIIEKLEENHNEGILLSNDSDLSLIKLMFLENSRRVTDFCVELTRLQNELDGQPDQNTTILVHFSNVTYGVAGTKEQTVPFLIYKEMDFVKKFLKWIGSLGVCLIVTGQVLEREAYHDPLRYIGYLEEKNGDNEVERLDIYEVLNACPAMERQDKIRTKEQFSEALNLFYRHDFYLARSLFSGVLKENPEDKIAKWYLFRCEKYLNSSQPIDYFCGLYRNN